MTEILYTIRVLVSHSDDKTMQELSYVLDYLFFKGQKNEKWGEKQEWRRESNSEV